MLISAFVMGLLSSFHCIGMCGAIAFSLPTQYATPGKKVAGILLYNGGRILTYSLLGMLLGIAGRQLHLAGFQQWFSIIAGLFILLVLVQSFFKMPILHLSGFGRVQRGVQHLIGIFLHQRSAGSMFFLGMANGLLPCGLIYLALTGAIAAGSVWGAAGFMAAFGMGTFPALFLLGYFGFLIRLSARNTMRKMVPYFVGIVAVLLILRGMGLNIPYVSPFIGGGDEVVPCR